VSDTNVEELEDRLRAWEGRALGPPESAPYAVNVAMIHHWCDAIGDENPVYTDPDFAAGSIHGEIVAPPTMLQAWTMRGLKRRPSEAPESAEPHPLQLLDEAGFTSVVATNCEQEYPRYLRPGDLLSHQVVIEQISEPKNTALGPGYFVTQRYEFRDQHQELVGTMRFRLLKFRPPGHEPSKARAAEAEQPLRPRPGITRDNAFFWDGVKAGKLLIQRCTQCGRLRHPPGPMCPDCNALEWDALEASGRGTLYSFVRHHHPTIPPFPEGHPVALIELAEGTRLVADIVGEPIELVIGMPLQVEFNAVDDDLVLPQFRPV